MCVGENAVEIKKPVVWELRTFDSLPETVLRQLDKEFHKNGKNLDFWHLNTKVGVGTKDRMNHVNVHNVLNTYKHDGREYEAGAQLTTFRIADTLLSGVTTILNNAGIGFEILGRWTFTPSYAENHGPEERQEDTGWRDVR